MTTVRDFTRDSRTARLAVSAAALALAGLVLAAWARWSAGSVIDEARVEAMTHAERIGALIGATVAAARARAEGLATTPAVREILYTDAATARAEGFALPTATTDTFEVVQLGRRRAPRTLYRSPEHGAPLAIARANEVRVEERAGELAVTVAVPALPMYAREGVHGAVIVATRVDLSSVMPALRASGLGFQLLGAGAPVPLTRLPAGEARAQNVIVPLPNDGAAARLSLLASVRTSGGAALWSGRVLLLAACAAALLTFVLFRRRGMPVLDDAPTARRPTPRQVEANAPLAVGPAQTARQKQSARFHPHIDAEAEAEAEAESDGDGDVGVDTLVDSRLDADAMAQAWSVRMPTPITQLRPAPESAPIVIDPRGEALAGRYQLLRPLGRGHLTDVYLAHSLRADAPGTVALKLVTGRDASERRAYLEAARRQQRIAHHHIAQVLDVGDGAVAYVATEYVEGCTLAPLLRDLFARDEPLPLPQTIAIVGAVCRALDAARPLVHGSVKASNVLVGRHNLVKLTDFGAPSSPRDRFVPEQYAGKPPDRRSDVYAAGLLLHALATGRRPDAASLHGDPGRRPPLPAPSTIRPELPRALDAVVAKATRFGPRSRYGTAGELYAALRDAAAGAAAASSSAWLGDWVERARRTS